VRSDTCRDAHPGGDTGRWTRRVGGRAAWPIVSGRCSSDRSTCCPAARP